MTMPYKNAFARLDEDDFNELLGRNAVSLIRTLDPEVQLHELASEVYPPSVMLRDDAKRKYIIETMPSAAAKELASCLGVDAADPWKSCLGKRFTPGSNAEDTLFDFFGLPVPPVLADEAAPATTEVAMDYGLFKHQRDAAHEVLDRLYEAPHRVMLHMPTGSGKTRTTMHVIADELRRHEPTITIWLAFNEELCEQAASEFEQAWQHLGDRRLHVHRFWGKRELDIDEVRDGFVVMGLPKASASMNRDTQLFARLADRAQLIVFDEAHQATAPTYNEVLTTLADRHAGTKLLGLSATPGRSWNDPEADRVLVDQFSSNKVMLKVEGYKNPVDFLIDDGYLAKPTFESLEHSGAALTEDEAAQLEGSLDIPLALLERLATDQQRNLLIVDRIEQILGNHERVLVFAATVEHAYLLATVLKARRIEANAVTGATEKNERERLIHRFRSSADGRQVLCNYGVLTTGFDAPRTSAAIIARPTQSLVLYSQMVGRAIRGRKAGGNDEALIVTVVDTNLPGFGQPQDAFTHWEEVWND